MARSRRRPLRAAGIEPARARELAILVIAALEGGFLLSRAAKSTEAILTLGRLVPVSVREALAADPDRPGCS